MRLSKPLALDAMGGDKAPESVVIGAKIALRDNDALSFVFHGDEAALMPLCVKHKLPESAYRIAHAESAVTMDEKPSAAVRRGKKTSMWQAIESVKAGDASAVVSAGNTGALMAMSKLVYKTLPGIDRPAIIAFFPAMTRRIVMLDLGANLQCSHRELVQFAHMGDAFAKVVLGLDRPAVGLLNVGAEEEKGHEEVRLAASHLKQIRDRINFYGYIEGHDIVEGVVDVVVTDGFTGNIALKTAEGTGKLIRHMFKEAFTSSIFAKMGFLLAKPAMATLKRKLDPRSYNGAMFIGLNGITVKSHGGADGKAYANAIAVAVKLVEEQINEKIVRELTQTGLSLAAQQAMADASTAMSSAGSIPA